MTSDWSDDTVLFADYKIIIAEDKQDVNYSITKLIYEYKLRGLQKNMKKTNFMVIGGTGDLYKI